MNLPSLPYLFAALPADLVGDYDPESPWSLLGDALNRVLDNLPGEAIEIALDPDCHIYGRGISIGQGTRLHPGSVVEGPVRIGRDVQIRPGALIRGGCWIGDGCVVGTNTEIKHSILLDGAKAPHISYVGDSILGRDVNLGAGTIASNSRHDGAEIEVPIGADRIATGLRKLGAILGDGCRIGCNSVLHPGVVIGSGTQTYPGVHLRSGVYPGDTVIKLRQELELVVRRMQ